MTITSVTERMIMTRRLYEEDAYCKNFSSTVISCEKNSTSYSVVLDQTAFFPEGGGQPSDTGYIDGKRVSDVQIIDGVIIHNVHEPVTPGAIVDCSIDWEQRFSNMQNHSGEHIVSGIIHSMFGFNNIGFHLCNGLVTLDVDGKISNADLYAIETAANRAVYENHSVTAYYPTPDELQDIEYRSKIDGLKNPRIVIIDACDCCACCAPHVSKTGEIGIIKLLNSYPNRGGTRIEMLCGIMALNDYNLLHSQNARISQLLSTTRYSVDSSVEKLVSASISKEQELKCLRRELAYSKLDIIRFDNYVCAFVKNVDFESLTYCLNNLLSQYEVCFIFSELSDSSMLYVLGSKKTDLRSFASRLNSEFSGRGGGKANYAQGKITATKQNVLDFVNDMFMSEN